MRRFWNQVFTCFSLSPRATANSTRSGVDRYLWVKKRLQILESRSLNGLLVVKHREASKISEIIVKFVGFGRISYLCPSKRFSNPVNCGSLKTVRAFLRRQWRNAFTFIPKPIAISAEHPPPGKKFSPVNRPAKPIKSNQLPELETITLIGKI